MPSNVIFKEKKFMWDGIDYPSKEKALEKIQTYKDNGFEVETFEESGKTYLYTRRVVKEIIVQAQ
jgi:hypothetical protein